MSEAIVQGTLLLLALFQERVLKLFGLSQGIGNPAGVNGPSLTEVTGALEVEELAQRMGHDLLRSEQLGQGAFEDSWEDMDAGPVDSASRQHSGKGEGIEIDTGSSETSMCAGGMCSA
jgi:hypothetical protein